MTKGMGTGVYIPDKIKILGRGLQVKVWSDDDGHADEGPLKVASVTVTWGELEPVAVTVEYGSHIREIGKASAPLIRVDYDAAHIAFDWHAYPARMRDVKEAH